MQGVNHLGTGVAYEFSGCNMTLLDREEAHPAEQTHPCASKAVLICGSRAQDAEELGQSLSEEGYRVAIATTPLQAIERLTTASVDAAVLFVPTEDRSWIDSIAILNTLFPPLPIIVVAEKYEKT